MGFLKLIGKETDKELVKKAIDLLKQMSQERSIVNFRGNGEDLLEIVERIKSGNERMTWRVWTGKLWGYLGKLINSSDKRCMMNLFKKVEKCESLIGKLVLLANNREVEQNSSRWNHEAIEAAEKAEGFIKKSLEDELGTLSKNGTSSNGDIANCISEIFCCGEIKSVSCFDVTVGNENCGGCSVPLLPLKREEFRSFGLEGSFFGSLGKCFGKDASKISMSLDGGVLKFEESK